MTKCDWRGAKIANPKPEQRFCKPQHRHKFHDACRAWGIRAHRLELVSTSTLHRVHDLEIAKTGVDGTENAKSEVLDHG